MYAHTAATSNMLRERYYSRSMIMKKKKKKYVFYKLRDNNANIFLALYEQISK